MIIIIVNQESEIDQIRSQAIGLYQHPNGTLEFIMETDTREDWMGVSTVLDTVRVTEFGAIQRTYGMPLMGGKFKMFEQGKTFIQMIADPFKWFNWYEENFK